MRRLTGTDRAGLARLAAWATSHGTSWPLLIAAFALGGGAWLWNHQGIPWQLASGDASAYADMARRIVHGEGFTAGLIWPAELWLGAGADHPAVRFPPAWPLALAVGFGLFGVSSAVAHGVVGVVFAALVAGATALGSRLAGRAAGVLSGVAVATTPALLLVSLDPVSETFFAATLVLCFLLCARRDPPLFAIGLACGLAYLTRYNGAVVLPALLGVLWLRGVGVRGLALCACGFLALALPWWLRNLAVAGHPFYSVLNLNLYLAPGSPVLGEGLFFQLEPDLASRAAMHPARKVALHLPALLAKLPYASANLAAFLGVVLACLRRDALSLGFALFAAVTLGVVSAALVLGRYFVPLLPVMLALGVMGWMRYGGRLRVPALALLLLAPWLPPVPAPLPDLQIFAVQFEQLRRGEIRPPAPDPALAACLRGEERLLVLAHDAPRIVWEHDVVGISAPRAPAAVAAILDAYPVAYVQLPNPRSVPPFRLVPAPACGPDWYVPR